MDAVATLSRANTPNRWPETKSNELDVTIGGGNGGAGNVHDYLPRRGRTEVKNVEYVLLAEFDIDKGSLLKYQYPRPTGLPDG